MGGTRRADGLARAVFGRTPRAAGRRRGSAEVQRTGGVPRGVRMTMPIVLAGAMTAAINLTGPIDGAAAAPQRPAKPKGELGASLRGLLAAAKSTVASAAQPASATTTYVVQPGDTVASIAGRHGLSTASVLALNGLGWKSLIFPGQVLTLSGGAATAPVPAAAAEPGRYTIQRGDTISGIAARFGVTTQSVLSANGLSATSIIYPGQTIAIPGADGTASAPIQPVSAVAPTTGRAAASTYTIQRGDTVSAVAARFGVSVQGILDANGLVPSSIIYAGRTLVIPGAPAMQAASAVQPASVGATGLTDEMAANARTIIRVGRSLGISDRGIVIALATAMQESSLRNIAYGDRDSVGLFQQRPSTGWGTREELLDPAHAARLFFDGRPGYTAGLRDIAGWEAMPLTVAAQKVQISAHPDAYAKWETSASAWLAQLG